MRASLPATLGQEKPHETQTPQPQAVADFCRALEVSAPTYYRWQQLCGGIKPIEAKRLKELELENTRLKRLLVVPAG